MTEQDFEKYWQNKLSRALEEVAGKDIRDRIMEGSQTLSDSSTREDIILWSRGAMERLDELLDVDARKEIMTRCACQYSKEALRPMRRAFEETGDIRVPHRMLQEQFESFLHDTLKLEANIIEDIVERGWGAAGIIKGDKIIATKIPKSGYLLEYLNEPDADKRRQLYCHCHRIRDVLKAGETISTTYCYCGAGFYKDIWEEITQRPVEIEMLASVLDGDDTCSIAITIPKADG